MSKGTLPPTPSTPNPQSTQPAATIDTRSPGVPVPSTNNAFYRMLPAGHVLRDLMSDHLEILAILAAMDLAATELEGDAASWMNLGRSLCEFGHQLAAAEPHHQKEEQVLFHELIQRGIVGPPHVMNEEHVGLRALKQQVIEHGDAVAQGDMNRRAILVQVTRDLTRILRLHIAKEDNILYPMAFNVIRESSTWDDMKHRCSLLNTVR